MSTAHDHTHNEAQDLTRTTTLHEREFVPALSTRFRALKGAIRATVGYEHDALRLRSTGRRPTAPEDVFGQAERVDRVLVQAADDIEPARRFTFTTRVEAQDEFMAWLQRQIDRGVVEPVGRSHVRSGRHYTAPYIRTAYTKALRDARARARARGLDVDDAPVQAVFSRPVHRRTVEALYTRAFDNLGGIGTDTQRAIRRELSQGLIEGWNPRRMASNLTDEVDDVGLTRARTLSRTEISNAYNTASATRYQEFGVEQVDILTSDPCPICAALAAQNPWPVDEAAGLIPGRTHPNCVCTITPTAA